MDSLQQWDRAFRNWRVSAAIAGSFDLGIGAVVGSAIFNILVAVERFVHAVLVLGDAFGTPAFLWGVIAVAAATSLPDLLVSVQAADSERGVVSISNVLGSNTFDLLVVIPVGVVLTGTAVVNFAIAAPMLGCLVGATVLLFVLLRTNLTVPIFSSFQ